MSFSSFPRTLPRTCILSPLAPHRWLSTAKPPAVKSNRTAKVVPRAPSRGHTRPHVPLHDPHPVAVHKDGTTTTTTTQTPGSPFIDGHTINVEEINKDLVFTEEEEKEAVELIKKLHVKLPKSFMEEADEEEKEAAEGKALVTEVPERKPLVWRRVEALSDVKQSQLDRAFDKLLENQGTGSDKRKKVAIQRRYSKLLFEHFRVPLETKGVPDVAAMSYVFENFLKYSNPTHVHWTLMIDAYRKVGHYDTALSYFDRLLASDEIQPDTGVYNVVLDIYCRQGEMGKAIALMKQMEKSKYYRPDVYSYTTIISALAREGDPQNAMYWFEDMRMKRIRPTAVSYTALITSLIDTGHKNAARQLFGEMKQRKINPGRVTYNIFIKDAALSGKIDLVEGYLEEMKKWGNSPKEDTLDGLLYGLGKANKIEEAVKYWRLLDKGQMGVKGPTFGLGNALLDGIGHQLQILRRKEKESSSFLELMNKGIEMYEEVLDKVLPKEKKNIEKDVLDLRGFRQGAIYLAILHRLEYYVNKFSENRKARLVSPRGLVMYISDNPPEGVTPQREIIRRCLEALRPSITLEEPEGVKGRVMIPQKQLFNHIKYRAWDRFKESQAKKELSDDTQKEGQDHNTEQKSNPHEIIFMDEDIDNEQTKKHHESSSLKVKNNRKMKKKSTGKNTKSGERNEDEDIDDNEQAEEEETSPKEKKKRKMKKNADKNASGERNKENNKERRRKDDQTKNSKGSRRAKATETEEAEAGGTEKTTEETEDTAAAADENTTSTETVKIQE